jgi:hypothetical protein
MIEVEKAKVRTFIVHDRLTFKDLKKRVTVQAAEQSRSFERLHNKPFWIWNIDEHKQEDIKTDRDCCFNHIIGLPKKMEMISL